MRRSRSILAILLVACVIFHNTAAVYAAGESNVSLTEAENSKTPKTGNETGAETVHVEGSGENTGTETGP